jgi:HEAT repeat protein
VSNVNSAREIVEAIERPEGSVPLHVLEAAQLEDLVAALAAAEEEGTRTTLCVVLGNRGDREAAPSLISALGDAKWKTRAAAADALGKIGLRLRRDGRPVPDEIGAALMKRWQPGESSWFLAALGATRYEPAEPLLIESLEHHDFDVRSAAAWGLGELGGDAARAALERAAPNEQESHVRDQIAAAVARL